MSEIKSTKLTPSLIEPSASGLVEADSPKTMVLKGTVQLISLDKDGEEIPGSEFTTSAAQYSKSYATNPAFKLKKNFN